MLKLTKQTEKGDTIVEVLISLAILTVVLVGAYYTANQSFRNDRDSIEHTEALTIAQAELEDLRTVGSISAGDQCFTSTGAASSSCYIPSGNTTENLSQSACQGQSTYCYDVDISKIGTFNFSISPSPTILPVTLNTYEVYVSWPALGGGTDNSACQGQSTYCDDVALYYRQDPT